MTGDRPSSPILPLSPINRRKLLLVGGTGLAMPFVNRLVSPARGQTRTLNFASYGGSYGDALRKAWLDPFEKETGIKVNLGVNASLALAKLQVMNPGGADWDIVDLTGAEFDIAVKQDMLLPLDRKQVDVSKIFPEYVSQYGFGYALYVWVMGWDRRKIPDANAPKNWAEFWDLKKYPGKRTLHNVRSNWNTLQAALMADGVPVDGVNPPDVERALQSLDKLGKANIVWSTTNQEPVQNLMSGETPLAGIFTGRAIIANRGGAQIGYALNQASVGGDSLGVMRNAKHPAQAFALLNYIATRGDRAAEFTAITSYGVPQVEVAGLLPKEATDIRDALPTNPDLKGKIVLEDDDWGAAHLEQAVARFREWQLG